MRKYFNKLKLILIVIWREIKWHYISDIVIWMWYNYVLKQENYWDGTNEHKYIGIKDKTS